MFFPNAAAEVSLRVALTKGRKPVKSWIVV
jgi:hypothetical protein